MQAAGSMHLPGLGGPVLRGKMAYQGEMGTDNIRSVPKP